MPVKLCKKCGQKPACVKSPTLPHLCYGCGAGPRSDASTKKSAANFHKRRPNYNREKYEQWRKIITARQKTKRVRCATASG